mmetsp:Transcript_37335/g.76562  ORF Transcript_37335/g.76562 Transcript_37335/m.76562 type:complete len:229 (+) Transcript_37335:1151-1837(+)
MFTIYRAIFFPGVYISQSVARLAVIDHALFQTKRNGAVHPSWHLIQWIVTMSNTDSNSAMFPFVKNLHLKVWLFRGEGVFGLHHPNLTGASRRDFLLAKAAGTACGTLRIQCRGCGVGQTSDCLSFKLDRAYICAAEVLRRHRISVRPVQRHRTAFPRRCPLSRESSPMQASPLTFGIGNGSCNGFATRKLIGKRFSESGFRVIHELKSTCDFLSPNAQREFHAPSIF